MKTSYFVALFAIVAVANAQSSYYTKDSKTQGQYADGTQSEITDSSDSAVNLNGLAKGGATALGSSDQNANVEQVANQ
ncbi:hypothetical protein INT45_002523 [Circinella minor]|uniref:Uncharacterized protein n=1 Tax=Circinella minor TaxID=1195481 RepID=A0A8H7VP23_9FUNG|nr:hypothetical protein INT45_002523 [Circinella minor]